MMVVQAGAERRVLDGNQGTREVLETIEGIGRSALTEMRRLVGMLRSDAPDPLAPQPGLDDLPLLVSQVREAGLPVELSVEGERRPLPVGIELSAYRIVPEALTNALKHAGNARASVQVRYGPDSLELEIVDNGNGSPVPVARGGHGLVGMRERVALYGGRFDPSSRSSVSATEFRRSSMCTRTASSRRARPLRTDRPTATFQSWRRRESDDTYSRTRLNLSLALRTAARVVRREARRRR
jgi:signal transduction histidine kinase